MAASDALHAGGEAAAGPCVGAATVPPAMTSAAASLSAVWVISATPCGSVWRKYTSGRGRLLLTSRALFCSSRYPDSPCPTHLRIAAIRAAVCLSPGLIIEAGHELGQCLRWLISTARPSS